MKVLLVGVGGVGEAIAAIAKPRSWMEKIVLADYNMERAREVQTKLGDEERFPVEFIDASPLIWPNCRSSGVVTAETITSALAPG